MDRPLEGIRVVEFASFGPVEHAGMLLADLGADVLQLHRPGHTPDRDDPMLRDRTFQEVDLKHPAGTAAALDAIAAADVLLEGFRPGVMERLGLGPDIARSRAERLVYTRITGWGQDGPLAAKAGHDINYLAETGALWAVRLPGGRPTPPLNMVGDNGGGSLYAVSGILAALYARERTGRGAVIDAAIVDGATSLLETVRGLRGRGDWTDAPASNLFDSGAPFYDTYACADGEYMAVGAIEPPFYAAFLEGLGLDPASVPDRDDRSQWPALRELFAARFRRQRRDAWEERFADLDACTTPVRSIREGEASAHLTARGSIVRTATGEPRSAPAPRIVPL